MRTKLLTLIFIGCLISAFSSMAATAISTIEQTITGEDFNHTLTPIAYDGTGGTLTFTQLGDFGSVDFELVSEFSVEGTELGTLVSYVTLGTYDVNTNIPSNVNLVEWSIDYYVSDTLLTEWLSDGEIDIFVDFNRFVTYTGAADTEYSSVTLEYNVGVSPVPIPAAIWLMGSGLLGLLGFGRKNKINAQAVVA